ncbi:MAG: 3-dehydroquinate synthase [Prolixibacteraceae bacterium]|nr:3-dehydroquinate synthase [Prolixibacteraceae bacterium]MBN2772714.1 3-dehydroquinate synthase [Prolixibacteraceae bacterium]
MGISKINSEILFSRGVVSELSEIINRYPKGKVFLSTETTVKELCFPVIMEFVVSLQIQEIVILSGEQNKKIESVGKIWEFLSKNGADRKSLLINLGGGMLTDLAGFAASTFKRGIDFVNIPTTLLAQVDASVGGKTGINFNGLKNEVGTFREPNAVLINVDFLKTLGRENFISGFAEMIKHGLIKSQDHLNELQDFDFQNIDYNLLEKMIGHSVEVKKYFVENDPTEKGIRKALNFGHTIGHAFESLAMEQNRPVLHGFAVAYGMIAELYLSMKKMGFPEDKLNELVNWINRIYGKFNLVESDFERLFSLMTHDKKNENNRINFTLIQNVGEVVINQVCSEDEIIESLKYFTEVQNDL